MSGPGAFLTAMLLAVAVIDFRTYRIPDWLSLPLVLAGLGWAAWAAGGPPTAHMIGALGGYASLATFGWVYFKRSGRDGLGLGDAKLFAAGGAWLGWQALPLVLLLASAAGLLYALFTLRLRAEARIAFGPWLALGIWLVWLFGQRSA